MCDDTEKIEPIRPNSVAGHWLGVLTGCANREVVTQYLFKDVAASTRRALMRRGLVAANYEASEYYVTEAGFAQERAWWPTEGDERCS